MSHNERDASTRGDAKTNASAALSFFFFFLVELQHVCRLGGSEIHWWWRHARAKSPRCCCSYKPNTRRLVYKLSHIEWSLAVAISTGPNTSLLIIPKKKIKLSAFLVGPLKSSAKPIVITSFFYFKVIQINWDYISSLNVYFGLELGLVGPNVPIYFIGSLPCTKERKRVGKARTMTRNIITS